MKQRRKIRRIVIRAGFILLLGAIVNIAVAWGCALWPRPAGGSMIKELALPGHHVTSDDAEWFKGMGANLTCNYVLSSQAFGVARREYLAFPADEGLILPLGLRLSAGWPTLSWRTGAIVHDAYNANRRRVVHCGVAVPFASNGFLAPIIPSLLPLEPIWPGFALNTLFYAAVLWLLFAAPFALRRWRRIKRGLCPACAYPVGMSDVCTECGGYISPRRFEQPGS